jgi:hypothetical protein
MVLPKTAIAYTSEPALNVGKFVSGVLLCARSVENERASAQKSVKNLTARKGVRERFIQFTKDKREK